MSIITLRIPFIGTKKTNIPVTPRGRALFTTDWYLNGRPVLSNHDNPRITLRNGLSC